MAIRVGPLSQWIALMGILCLAIGLLIHLPDDALANGMALQVVRAEWNSDRPGAGGWPTIGRPVEADHAWTLARWHRARQEYGTSEDCYRVAIAQHPWNPLIKLELGNLVAEQGREQEAIQWWRQAESAGYWTIRGADLLKEGDHERAAEYLTRARTIDPANTGTYFVLGELYFDLEEWDQAITAFSFAIQNRANAAWLYEAYTHRGQARFNAGEGLAAAEADLQHALSLQPDNPWSHIRLCDLYRRAGQLDEALCACQRATSLAPRSAFAHYYLGRVWYAQGQFSLAVEEFQAALQYDGSLNAAAQWLERAEQTGGGN